MKVGILTRRYGFNMGSTLQAFAMQELVRSLGHDCEVINYDESSAHTIWKIRPLIDHLQYYLHIPPFGKRRNYLVHRMDQEKRFRDFEHKYLKLSGSLNSSKKQLRLLAARYEKIVVGSDQIWNPFLFDANYYGAFLSVKDRRKIVPYAPSIGTSDMRTINEKQVELMNALDALSCREEKGAEIIKEYTNKDVTVVLDPTLMISKKQWMDMAECHEVKGVPDSFIVTYFLGMDIPQKEIDRIAFDKHSKVVNISMFNKPHRLNADFHLADVGPGEFLWLLKNASYVLTDSFHATIFSWIFETNFNVFERFREDDMRNQNSRIHTLLSVLGCPEKVFGSDAIQCNSSIETMREKSKSFLNHNLT